MRWFTSDLHFFHANVIRYCDRPYNNVYEMNFALINNWNDLVSPKDEVVFLGDFCMNPRTFNSILELNFQSMIFVKGNHDKVEKYKKMLVEWPHLVDKIQFCDNVTIEVDGRKFFCVHRPVSASDELPNIIGHVHEKWKLMPAGSVIAEHGRSGIGVEKMLLQPCLNVGCDVHGYKPINERQLLECFDGIQGT